MSEKNQYLPAKVNVQLAVSKEEVKSNIETNMAQIPVWFDRLFYANGYEAIIISAGPSMEKYVEELNLAERMKHPHRTFVVFCVKHAYPRLMEMGIEPDFCVMLDGRPFDGESTHGFNRKELFKTVSSKTVFMVASMSHPGYAKYLMEHGGRVIGWHTEVDGLKEFHNKIKTPILSGGTSSGTRCISLAHGMGIREISLVGFDSCFNSSELTEENLKELDKKGRPKYLPVDLPITELDEERTKNIQEKVDEISGILEGTGIVFKGECHQRFYTTGELMAQAQDFEQVFTNPNFDIHFKVYDDGIVSHMFSTIPTKAKRGFSFINFFKKHVPKKEPNQKIPKVKAVPTSDTP